jgi:hypothetical protein
VGIAKITKKAGAECVEQGLRIGSKKIRRREVGARCMEQRAWGRRIGKHSGE